MRKAIISAIGAVVAASLGGGAAQAVDYYLVAKEFTQTMPDGRDVLMWGFALDSDDDITTSDPGAEIASSPGPTLYIPGNQRLRVFLRNELSAPVSLTIPGLMSRPNDMRPVFIDPGSGSVVATGSRPAGDVTSRIRSSAKEVQPGQNSVYIWPATNTNPGTYLYRSATRPQVQVQMGLYGAVYDDSANNTEAYPGQPYDAQHLVQFSEVDADLHDRVRDEGYDAIGGTRDYAPDYFLINGAPFSGPGSNVLAGGAAGDQVLLRMINHGLRSVSPVVHNQTLSIIADDGNQLPFARPLSVPLLAAGQTKDAMLSPAFGGSYAIYDRRLNLTNGGVSGGGAMAYLTIDGDPNPGTGGGGGGGGGSPTPPVALADGFVLAVDALGSLSEPAPGMLGNDSGAGLVAVQLSSTTNGALVFGSDGGFSYTPNPGFLGVDGFTYAALDPATGLQSAPASVTIEVNGAPTANGDQTCTQRNRNPNNRPDRGVIQIDVAANDVDPEGALDLGTVALASASTALGGGVVALGGGLVEYTPPRDATVFNVTDSFTYTIADNQGQVSNSATVEVTLVQRLGQVSGCIAGL